MPRLFTAIQLPSSVAMQLSLLQSGLPGAKWIDPENFHITLRFVGDVETPLAREIADTLERVNTAPFELQLENLDIFGGSKPHSLFAGIKHSQQLMDLQAQQERICQHVIGLAPETRKYKPHVTIARVRGSKTKDLAAYLSGHGGFQSVAFQVERFVLLSSRDSVGGGPYITEESYQLIEKDFADA